jgi:predicted nuclease of predicted toxin-antitoxin system
LGRHHLPTALRALGYVVHTLADVYGEKRAQEVKDREWIERAGRENWVVLTKDDRIRYRRVERNAFVSARLRVFCLTTAKLQAEEQTQRFVSNINRIVQRARSRGPYIYGVYDNRLDRIWPPRG